MNGVKSRTDKVSNLGNNLCNENLKSQHKACKSSGEWGAAGWIMAVLFGDGGPRNRKFDPPEKPRRIHRRGAIRKLKYFCR